MRVNELRDALEDLDGDLEVRIGWQPSWPLRMRVAGVVTPQDLQDIREDEYDEEPDEAESFVWLVGSEGVDYNEHPYAPRALWEVS